MNWPNIKFPPVNLHSNPVRWPKDYLRLEAEYTKDISDQFIDEPLGTMFKKILRLEVQNKREEFNRLWNARSMN